MAGHVVVSAAVLVTVGHHDRIVERGDRLPAGVDSGTISRLVGKGMIASEIVPEAEPAAPEVVEEAPSPQGLDGLDLPGLRAFAAEHGIDLGGATKTAALLADITAALSGGVG